MTFAPEYMQGSAKEKVLEWSSRNSGKKKTVEINYSSRSSLLHSHHQTSDRQSLDMMHWLKSTKNMQIWQVYFGHCIRVNVQSHARQQRYSQGSSFTDIFLTSDSDLLATETADLSNMTALVKQYVKAFAFMCLPLKMMLMVLWKKKGYYKRQKLWFRPLILNCFYERWLKSNIPVNFIFKHEFGQFVLTRRIVPEDLLSFFFKVWTLLFIP